MAKERKAYVALPTTLQLGFVTSDKAFFPAIPLAFVSFVGLPPILVAPGNNPLCKLCCGIVGPVGSLSPGKTSTSSVSRTDVRKASSAAVGSDE